MDSHLEPSKEQPADTPMMLAPFQASDLQNHQVVNMCGGDLLQQHKKLIQTPRNEKTTDVAGASRPTVNC